MVAELVSRPDRGRVFEASRRVRLADSSAGGRLRFDAIARYLQDVANDDAREADSPNFTAWVARRTVLRVVRFPRYLDMISMATWCSGLGPRWAERRYSIRAPGEGDSNDGSIEAATLWVHVDLDTMKPIPVPAGFEQQFGEAAQGRTISARQLLPPKPPAADADESGARRSIWPLRFVDFDVLGHVNNSVYWAMVEEQLARRRDMRAPLTVTLEHQNAIDPGAEVALTVVDSSRGFEMWVTAGGAIRAVVSASNESR